MKHAQRHPSTGSSAARSSRSTISRRTLLVAAIATPSLAGLLAACGDRTEDSAGNDGTAAPGVSTPAPTTAAPDPTPTTVPPTTAPAADIGYPTDASAVVLRVGYEGGFVPVGHAFVNLPNLLVSGDGRAFTPAPITLEYPGPLLAPMNVQTISPDGIRAVLALADAAGLLGEIPDYASDADATIADAPDTVVRITTDAGTFEHRAYALGIVGESADGKESTPARQALLDFVTAVGMLDTAAGAGAVGEAEPFVPTEYRFQATLFGDQSDLDAIIADTSASDPAPTVVDWWAEATGISLAYATECEIVSADEVLTLFSDARSNTYFRDGSQLYVIAVASVLPGDPGCPAEL